MSNTYTKTYADGSGLTEAKLDTAYQSLQLDIANTALMTTGSTAGYILTSNGSNIAASFQAISDPLGPFALRNYGLKATVASGVLKISLKTKALADPSGSDKVDFTYSTNGTTSASYTAIQVTGATSISVNASATLGAGSTSTFRIFVYGYYNTVTTTVRMAVAGTSEFDSGQQNTTTAISASADSSTVLYATAALTVVPRLLGWVDAAANSSGNWQTPTHVNITNNSNITNKTTANQIGASMSATGADAIGQTMSSTGANALVAQVNSATAANNIGNQMGASGANHIGTVMGATGANPLVNSIDSSTAADHVFHLSSAGSKATQSGITTTSLPSTSASSRASIAIPSTGRYLIYGCGAITSTTANSVAQITLDDNGSSIGPAVNVQWSGASGTDTRPFTIMCTVDSTASHTIHLLGKCTSGTAKFSTNGFLECVKVGN